MAKSRRPSPTFLVLALLGAAAAAPPFASALALVMSSSAPSPPPSVGKAGGGGGSVVSSSSLPLDRLSSHANAYAAAHGLQIERRSAGGDSSSSAATSSSSSSSSSFQCAPISLLPNAYPSTAFSAAKSLAAPFNELVDRISRDGEFLVETLGGDVSDADPFTGKLLELYEEIYLGKCDDGGAERGKFASGADRLGIQRSDYMLNEAAEKAEAGGGASGGESAERTYELKQVELNTIAASFAGLAVNCGKLHRHLSSRFSDEILDFLDGNARAVMGEGHVASADNSAEAGVPENPALICLPRAMHLTHERYLERHPDAVNPVVLFVVQEGETNTVDQRMLEFALWENHGVPVVRMSLTAAGENLELDEGTGALFIGRGPYSPGGRREVTLAYYRAGYAPTDYPGGYDGVEWRSRAEIERGRCAKCPSLGYHLAGTKKVQQELARPGRLERFFPPTKEGNDDKVAAMRGAFAGLHSLGSDATKADLDAVKDAIGGGEGRYVLKPQREGGGYNYYGRDLAEKLRSNVETSPGSDGDGDKAADIRLGKDLAEFILMERLFPPRQTAVLLRSGVVEGSGRSVSELGCFGTIVSDGGTGDVVRNEYAGWILRTKFEDVDEGGVASGFATLSSPYLC